MKWVSIAFKDLRVRFQDRKELVMLLLMPLLLTAILGTALGGTFGEGGGAPDTTVAVAMDAEDEMIEQLVEEVWQGEGSPLTVVSYPTEAMVKEAVQTEEVDVGVYFPSGWGEQLMDGASPTTTIHSSPEKTIQTSIVESMTTTFISRVQSQSLTTQSFVRELSASAADGEITVQPEAQIEGFSERLSASSDIAVENDVATDSGSASISGMQYYAAAMGVMFLLFNATIGAKSFIEERNTQTLARMFSAPVRPVSIVAGKFMGTMLFSFLQFVLFIGATALLFQVSWGENYGQLAALGVVYSMAVAGIAILVASLFKEEGNADAVGSIGVQVFALLGGSMIPIAAFPGGLQMVASLTPNKWALDSFLAMMSGAEWASLVLPFLVLSLFGILSLLIGSLRLRGSVKG
ncbi:ABC transporter permease [Halobacillus fulvus]|nr:ABC transporter permease [Halobacillus fulvus]